MLRSLITLIQATDQERTKRRQLRALLKQEDRLLTDMGLTRADVEHALRQPLHVSARDEADRLSRLTLTMDRQH